MSMHSKPLDGEGQLSPGQRQSLLEEVKDFRKKNAGALDLARIFSDFSTVKSELKQLMGELHRLTARVETVTHKVDEATAALVSDLVGPPKEGV